MQNNLITNRVAILRPEYRQFIQSDFIETVTRELGEAAQLSDEQLEIFSNAIVLFTLFFLNVDEFITFVSVECGVTETEARQLVGGVLAVLPNGLLEQQIDAYEKINESPEPSAQDSTLQSEIAEAEAALQSIQPTQADSTTPNNPPAGPQKETTYVSNQSSLLADSKIKPIADTNTRWESHDQ